jgi:hypothetical protein
LKTSRTAYIVKVSAITPHFVLTTLSDQSNLSDQNTQSTSTSGSMHTQSGTLGISIEDEMRLPTFRGDGF